MALKRASNGTYIISSEKEAKTALNLFQALADEMQAIREEHGLQEMEEDAIELKRAVTHFMVGKGKKRIEIPDYPGMYGTLIESGYDKRIIATKEELDDYMSDDKPVIQEKVTPLRTFLLKKYGKGTKEFKEAWNRLTKKVADEDAIAEAINAGEFTVEQISKCYIEKQKAPYLRLFGKD